MNKTELVQEVAECAGISKISAYKAVTAVMDTVSKQLSLGNQVALTGFGTFSTKERKERKGQNPKTGDPIQIPKATVPNFKAGKTLKDTVNNG